jgi:hypothetical protein
VANHDPNPFVQEQSPRFKPTLLFYERVVHTPQLPLQQQQRQQQEEPPLKRLKSSITITRKTPLQKLPGSSSTTEKKRRPLSGKV